MERKIWDKAAVFVSIIALSISIFLAINKSATTYENRISAIETKLNSIDPIQMSERLAKIETNITEAATKNSIELIKKDLSLISNTLTTLEGRIKNMELLNENRKLELSNVKSELKKISMNIMIA